MCTAPQTAGLAVFNTILGLQKLVVKPMARAENKSQEQIHRQLEVQKSTDVPHQLNLHHLDFEIDFSPLFLSYLRMQDLPLL
jgi:hypothetical protein